MADDERTLALVSAGELRGKLCASARLSKRAAVLLRSECNTFAIKLLARAIALTDDPVDAQDVWEALLAEESYSWLVERLGLWTTPSGEQEQEQQQQQQQQEQQQHVPLPIPPDVPLPLPPAGLAPDSDLLPRLFWCRAPHDREHASGGNTRPLPFHDALLEARTDPPPRGVGEPLHSFLLGGG